MFNAITLSSARTVCGYTQEEAARHCGVSPIIIEKYEKDCTDMPINLACKISRLYDISLDDLYIGKAE
ncbi:helix-turn-helix transcriptional regulator [Desulfosporosinus sp. SB140]|uniref:helix-turn-helix transcriptional regulator n=1 Tax=Desulfosporosinus paludis TaxID=3115649 RepID=UPI00388FED54